MTSFGCDFQSLFYYYLFHTSFFYFCLYHTCPMLFYYPTSSHSVIVYGLICVTVP